MRSRATGKPEDAVTSLRILLAIPHYLSPNEGAPGVTMRLAEAYRRLGHETATCGLDDFHGGCGPMRTPLMFPLYLRWRYRAKVASGELDVVDAAGACGWALGVGWPTSARALLVMRSHGSEREYRIQLLRELRVAGQRPSLRFRAYGRLLVILAAVAMRRAGLVLQLNREDQEFAVTRLSVPRERVRIVPNGIDATLLGLPFEPTPQAADRLRIAWIGAWQPRKGPRYAVQTLSSVMRRFAHIETTLLGTGLEVGRVLAEFPEALRPRLRVIPHYENGDLPKLLAGHQIELMTSLVEAFGVAQLEAMACGLAPVAPAISGPLEVITNGMDGILIPRADSAAAAAAIARLVENRDLLDSLRRGAQAKAQGFGWDAVARLNLELYEEYLGMGGVEQFAGRGCLDD